MAQLDTEYDLYSIEVWRQIFKDVFGENPSSSEDKRWNTLLHEGCDGGFGALDIALNYFNSLKLKERAG